MFIMIIILIIFSLSISSWVCIIVMCWRLYKQFKLILIDIKLIITELVTVNSILVLQLLLMMCLRFWYKRGILINWHLWSRWVHILIQETLIIFIFIIISYFIWWLVSLVKGIVVFVTFLFYWLLKQVIRVFKFI